LRQKHDVLKEAVFKDLTMKMWQQSSAQTVFGHYREMNDPLRAAVAIPPVKEQPVSNG
jgi:hypothetical protein